MSDRSDSPTNERLSPSRFTMVNSSFHDFSMGLDSSMKRSTSSKSTSPVARTDTSLFHMPNVVYAAPGAPRVPPMPNTSTMNAHSTNEQASRPT